VLESPVRTMRVNLIGTYNVLEAALATKDTVERLIEFSTSEVFGTYAFPRRRDERDDAGLGRRGALDLCRLEARRRAHGARLPPRVRPADRLVRPFNVYGPARSAAARSVRSSRRRSPDAT
jgi:dTDP-glucose 4,6-dehydratase